MIFPWPPEDFFVVREVVVGPFVVALESLVLLELLELDDLELDELDDLRRRELLLDELLLELPKEEPDELEELYVLL